MSPASRPCSPCASRGRPGVPATRVMADGMGKCDACFTGKLEPLPPPGARVPADPEKALDFPLPPPVLPKPNEAIRGHAAARDRVPRDRSGDKNTDFLDRMKKRKPLKRTGESWKPMPKRKEIDWAQAQRYRNDGVAVATIAHNMGCSEALIYTKTKPMYSSVRQGKAPMAPGIGFVPIDEVPGRGTDTEAEYRAFYEAVLKCPKGQAVRGPVPARFRKSKGAGKNIHAGVARLLRRAGKRLRVASRVENGVVYLIPSEKK
jgi:hypothetical protein